MPRQDAEKVIRRLVPANVRTAAIAMAHERFMAKEEDSRLWERMAWTERLRLCEVIYGKTMTKP